MAAGKRGRPDLLRSGRKRLAGTLRLPHVVFGAIFVAEVLIIIYMKVAMSPPQPKSALAAFTSSVALRDGAGEADDDGWQVGGAGGGLLSSPIVVACLSTSDEAVSPLFELTKALITELDPDAVIGPQALDQRQQEQGLRNVVFPVSGLADDWDMDTLKAADFVLVAHDEPYRQLCQREELGERDQDATSVVPRCRQLAEQVADLEAAVASLDNVLHVDAAALRSLAGAAMVALELLEQWGVDEATAAAAGLGVKALVEEALAGSFSDDEEGMDRACVAAAGADRVCRAWHAYHGSIFPLSGSPVVEDDALPSSLEEGLEMVDDEDDPSPAVAPEHADEQQQQQQQQQQQPAPSPKAEVTVAEEGGAQAPGNGGGRGGLHKPPRDVQPAAETEAQEEIEEIEEQGEMPQLYYCLPGGGFNDLTVEVWKCVEWAVANGRIMVNGFENYLPVLPPYTPYFEWKPIPGLRTMAPAEAARLIAAHVDTVTIFPRRLQKDKTPLLEPVADSEEDRLAQLSGEKPWRFNWDELHRLGFQFERQYRHDVVVFHRKGNVGSGLATLQHITFSEEVKRTFLERWSRLRRPYVGLHIRSTDKACAEAAMQRALKRTRKLKRDPEMKEVTQVYVASDAPTLPEAFVRVIKRRQQREIVSFTYHPRPKNVTAAAADSAAQGSGGDNAVVRPEDSKAAGPPLDLRYPGVPPPQQAGEPLNFRKKSRMEFARQGIMPLHLADYLTPQEKHQTNVDAFVDLLLLAMSERLITTCGGYGKLAEALHGHKATVLSLIGELPEGHDVKDDDSGLDVEGVLEGVVARLGLQGEGGGGGSAVA